MKLPSTKAKGLVVAMIPTYDEKENIREVIDQVLALRLRYDLNVLVVDDDSPDGTWQIVQKIARQDGRVHLLRRTKRRGRGTAGIDGYREALRLGADFVVEMDGDLSHQPGYITQLVDACHIYDMVLGSRFVHGGGEANRSIVRRGLTALASRFVRAQFGVTVKDPTAGYRCFRRKVLEAVDVDDLISVGPSIVLETLYKAHLLGFSIGEIPITFIDREKGQTKLNVLTLLETFLMVLKFKRQYASLRRAGGARP